MIVAVIIISHYAEHLTFCWSCPSSHNWEEWILSALAYGEKGQQQHVIPGTHCPCTSHTRLLRVLVLSCLNHGAKDPPELIWSFHLKSDLNQDRSCSSTVFSLANVLHHQSHFRRVVIAHWDILRILEQWLSGNQSSISWNRDCLIKNSI